MLKTSKIVGVVAVSNEHTSKVLSRDASRRLLFGLIACDWQLLHLITVVFLFLVEDGSHLLLNNNNINFLCLIFNIMLIIMLMLI